MSINFFDNYKVTLNSFIVHTPAAKAGGHSLIWSKRLCAREQGMVLGPPGSSLKQGVQIYYLTS